MVIRDSSFPRLPRMYWGEIIYATPGCGKTYVANKYRDVVDGDDLIVKAIEELEPDFYIGYVDDPRKVIFRYFRHINFNKRKKWNVYNRAVVKMKELAGIDDVVLFGTIDLMHIADRIFIERADECVRAGFDNHKQEREEHNAMKYHQAYETQTPVHYIYEYLDNSLQQQVRNQRH